MKPQHEKFCRVYAVCNNAVRSYMEAYGTSYDTACSNAYRLMEKEGIKAQIREFKELNKSETVLIVDNLKKRIRKRIFEELSDIDLMLGEVKKRLEKGDNLSTKQLLDLSRVRGLEIGNYCRLIEAISQLEGLDIIEDNLLELLKKADQSLSLN